ncbi:hypothetical protein FD723_40030 (plasmid) [Nostoc sp. C052]|uniref:hypothetical protein n=1 Tax=Nostoc sp. C052 TaxID=2576902 RepID=UPI0015C2F038|nr:hypothetical protein [Nostoc sp. C052]QLE46403.1 hypothetical protein FD723_40030 [Nostoc sp. C052]
MKIIRSFCSDFTRFEAIANLELQHDEFVAKSEAGILVYPSVHPLLAQRFFGFEVKKRGEVQVAVKLVDSKIFSSEFEYAYFDGENWQGSIERHFQNIELIRQGMLKWQGGIQFILKILPHSSVQEISFGYEVNFEITEYLLNYAIPDFLKIPCFVTYMSRTDATGKVQKPVGYEFDKIIEISVQPMGSAPIPAQIVAGEIKLPQPILKQVVQVNFSVIPYTQFTRGLYQIEKLPCVVIRELPIRNVITPYRMDVIESQPGINEFDYPVATFDLPVEVLVMSQNMTDAKMIMRSLIQHIRNSGKIYIPPTDTEIGVFLVGIGELDGLEFEGGMGIEDVSGDFNSGVATAKFKLSLKNLDY